MPGGIRYIEDIGDSGFADAMRRITIGDFGAEVGNAREANVTVAEFFARVLTPIVARLRIRVWDDAAMTALSATATLAQGGGGEGTVISGGGTNDMVVDSDVLSSSFSLEVTDASGAVSRFVSIEPAPVPNLRNSGLIMPGFVSAQVDFT